MTQRTNLILVDSMDPNITANSYNDYVQQDSVIVPTLNLLSGQIEAVSTSLTNAQTTLQNNINKVKSDLSTSLTNAQTTLQNNINTKVAKAGDTMTGNLTISKAGTSDLALINKNIDYASATAPSSAIRVGGLFCKDKNNGITGCFQNYIDTSNNTISQIYARNKVSGSEKSCAIGCYVGPTGSVWTAAPTPATTDNSTKIATTAYVKALLGTVYYIKEKWVSGTSWYRVWSDGWIEQGGRTTFESDARYSNATFHKAFKNTNYTLIASGVKGGMSNSDYCHIFSYSTTGARFNSAASSNPIMWYACGY